MLSTLQTAWPTVASTTAAIQQRETWWHFTTKSHFFPLFPDISNGTFDALVEANEQSIESEFLRLFDSARCLSRICAPSTTEDSPSMCRRMLGTRIVSGSARAAERDLPLEERSIAGRRTQSSTVESWIIFENFLEILFINFA